MERVTLDQSGATHALKSLVARERTNVTQDAEGTGKPTRTRRPAESATSAVPATPRRTRAAAKPAAKPVVKVVGKTPAKPAAKRTATVGAKPKPVAKKTSARKA